MTAEIVSTCCCSNCPEYKYLEAIFQSDKTTFPQSLTSAYINALNNNNIVVQSYAIGYNSGDNIEDFMTGFSGIPVYLNGIQVGLLTWNTTNTETGIIPQKLHQGDLYLNILEQKEPQGNLIKYTRGRCVYHAADVTISRGGVTGFSIKGAIP